MVVQLVSMCNSATTPQSALDKSSNSATTLGYNYLLITAPTPKSLLAGKLQVKRGLHATGPLAFEAYNGSYCPPVRGYYFVGATLHLNSSLNHDPTKNGTTPLVTVSVCLFGFCYNERVA